MHSFSLKCFGVGDGWPCADRNHSSFLYRFGTATFLIDCGEPVSREFKATGISYDEIDRIIISHLHCDHIGGFFMLMQGFWLEQRRRDLPVHLSEHGIIPIQQMLNAAYIFEELFAFKLQFEPLEAEKAIVTNDVRVTAFPTTHLDNLRESFQKKYPQSFQAFSFLFESKQFRIAHSADIGSIEDLEPLLTKPVDLLVCELAHVEPKSLFRYLGQKNIRKIAFMHLGRKEWDSFEQIQALALERLNGIPFSFIRDGGEVTL